MIVRIDGNGRLLCPDCGAGLYLTVRQMHYGVPAYYNYGEAALEYSTWDADHAEEYTDALACHRCDFSAVDTTGFHTPGPGGHVHLDLDELQFVAEGDGPP